MRAAIVRSNDMPQAEPVDAIVSAKGICKSYGTTEALRDRFAPGESATLEDIFFRATEGAGAEATG